MKVDKCQKYLAYISARSAKNILTSNTQVKHESGQKQKILINIFAHSAKKIFKI